MAEKIESFFLVIPCYEIISGQKGIFSIVKTRVNKDILEIQIVNLQ